MLLAGLLFAALPAHSERMPPCPDFPAPEGGRLQWVAPHILYSGIPMQIREFTSDLILPQQVLAFYRNRWGGSPPGYHEYEVGEWQAIATFRGNCYYTVQVQPASRGSKALLGVSARPEHGQPKAPGQGFPLLTGTKVVNDIDHFDGGKTGRSLLLMNSYSADHNAHYYRRALAAEGWVAIVDKAVSGPRGLAHVLVLKRGHHEANLAISPDRNGTSIVVTMVDRP
jgi:hypothetical protein